MPVATNFASAVLLTSHYTRHKGDFSVSIETEYENKARAFLNTSLTSNSNIEEKQRKRRGILVDEWVRYDKSTNEFAIVQKDGTICTYFKPMMFNTAPPGTPRDKMHKRASNYQYFLDECELPK